MISFKLPFHEVVGKKHVIQFFDQLDYSKNSPFWDAKVNFLAGSKRSTNKPQRSKTFESVSNFRLPFNFRFRLPYQSALSAIMLSKCRR